MRGPRAISDILSNAVVVVSGQLAYRGRANNRRAACSPQPETSTAWLPYPRRAVAGLAEGVITNKQVVEELANTLADRVVNKMLTVQPVPSDAVDSNSKCRWLTNKLPRARSSHRHPRRVFSKIGCRYVELCRLSRGAQRVSSACCQGHATARSGELKYTSQKEGRLLVRAMRATQVRV